ncbi:MAG: response regulator [Fibromonadales bacterium]|nr:response regulator [Fibromonadales bacterium]
MENSFIVSIFAVINLTALALVCFYYIQFKKKRGEAIKQLLQDLEVQNREEFEHKISKVRIDFLMKMGQEVRYPLNTIMGFNDLILSNKNLDQDVFESASKIQNSCTALINMVDDILDFSKIEGGRLELTSAEYDLALLIKNVISSNMVNMEFKSIKFNLDIDAQLPSHLIGDEFRVKQIFGKILSNAFKYTRSGTVEWSIGFERKQKDILIVSKVKDSGIGIKKENLEKIFSAFNGDDGSSIDGMRLGLAITKEILNKMGGTIEVESEYGRGSVFTIKIKQQVKDETPIDEKIVSYLKNLNCQVNKVEKTEKPVYNQMPYAQVLIVDDMALNLEVAQSLMRPYGMQIDAAPSGKIAVAKIMNQSTKYSAIFMDYMMPEMDGVEATNKIRALDSDYAKNVPIIALTANAMAGSEKIFLDNGFNDVLIKPIDISKLDIILKKWVRDEAKEV